jgi:hypothetical protein
VTPVEVGSGAVARVRKQRFGDGELLDVRLDDDPAVEERFAFPGTYDVRLYDAPV